MPEIGHGIFAKKPFSIKDIIICEYHVKMISRKKAYAKTQQSNYIVKVTDLCILPLYIDGLDGTRNKCFKRGYANDATAWDGTQADGTRSSSKTTTIDGKLY